jgi:hypothetical protein
VEDGVHTHGKPMTSLSVSLSTRPSPSLRRLPLLPEKEEVRVRRRVKEGVEVNQPRVVMERREQRWMRAYPRIESSTGYYHPPPGAQVVPLLRFRQALALGGGERGEALSSAGSCCGGWSRAPLFLEARPVASYSGDRRRAWVMHH